MLVKKMWLFLLSFLVIFDVSTAQYEENHGLSVVPEKAEENKNGFFEEVEHMDSVNKEQSDVIMEEENSLADHVFIPTSEWQTVKPGQHVPRGLHVRLDVSTGRKEAKLMEDDGGSKYHVWDNGERKGEVAALWDLYSLKNKRVVNADHKYFTIEEIKSALKEMKNDNAATEKEDQNQGADNEGDGAVKSQFRPYAELKREFESLNMHIKTDIEIMKELLTEYRMVNSSAERRLAILEELEYYVHQIDNAQNFVDLGGFKILREVFNDSSSEFRAVAGFLLGSACQSNPKVQVAAVEYGFLHHIVQNFGKERDFSVRKKYLYSISAVLRQFPYAQKKFLELGGAEIFGQIFNEVGQDKQKVKIVTLLFDLIMEKQYVEKTEKTDSERLKQYEEVQLLETLVEKGWCSLVPKLLNLPDWDSQEKVLLAMKLMFSDCRTEFLKSLRTLNQLKARYEQELSSYEQAANDYLKGLLTTVNQMISTWFYHEEL